MHIYRLLIMSGHVMGCALVWAVGVRPIKIILYLPALN